MAGALWGHRLGGAAAPTPRAYALLPTQLRALPCWPQCVGTWALNAPKAPNAAQVQSHAFLPSVPGPSPALVGLPSSVDAALGVRLRGSHVYTEGLPLGLMAPSLCMTKDHMGGDGIFNFTLKLQNFHILSVIFLKFPNLDKRQYFPLVGDKLATSAW